MSDSSTLEILSYEPNISHITYLKHFLIKNQMKKISLKNTQVNKK